MNTTRQPFKLDLGSAYYAYEKKIAADLYESHVDPGHFFVSFVREDIESNDKTWPNIFGIEIEAVPRLIEYLQRAHRVHSSITSKKS